MSSQQSFEEGIVFLISTRSTAQKVESRVSRGGAQDFLIPQPVSSRMKSHRLPHSGTNGLNRWVNLYGLKASPITAPYVLIHNGGQKKDTCGGLAEEQESEHLVPSSWCCLEKPRDL